MPDPNAPIDNPYAAPKAPIAPADAWMADPSAPPVASLAWRFLSFVADYVFLLWVVLDAVFAVPMLLLGDGPPPPFGRIPPGQAFGPRITVAVCLLVWVGYFAGQESSRWQATLGKRLLRLRVLDLDNGRISFGRASARALIKLIGVVLFFLRVVPAFVTRRRRTLHDLISGTVVVSTKLKSLPPIQESGFPAQAVNPP